MPSLSRRGFEPIYIYKESEFEFESENWTCKEKNFLDIYYSQLQGQMSKQEVNCNGIINFTNIGTMGYYELDNSDIVLSDFWKRLTLSYIYCKQFCLQVSQIECTSKMKGDLSEKLNHRKKIRLTSHQSSRYGHLGIRWIKVTVYKNAKNKTFSWHREAEKPQVPSSVSFSV